MARFEQDLIDQIFEAFDELRRFGWQEPLYAPAGEEHDLEVIQAGSTGIHPAWRDEEGLWYIAGDPTEPPLLWRRRTN